MAGEIDFCTFMGKNNKISCKTEKKMEIVKGMDGNSEEFSQFEITVLFRLQDSLLDDKVSVAEFRNRVLTDYAQEIESITAKTQEINNMKKEAEPTLDINT